MANKIIPEQVSHSSLNDLRKELDGKIDKKIPTSLFLGIITLLVLGLIAVFGYIGLQLTSIGDKIDSMKHRITILETKSNSPPNSPPTSPPTSPSTSPPTSPSTSSK